MTNVARLAVAGLIAACASLVWAEEDCCKELSAKNGWCGQCKHGYFNGVEIKSQKLHESLRGEAVKADAIKCPDCVKALASGGMCSHCNVGFAHQQKFASPVAYHLMSGQHVNAADIKCDGCKKASADHGWCEPCKAGLVGCEKFTDKAAYERAVKAREILVNANSAAAKCDGCAVAMVRDGKCEGCKVAFKDGKPVKN